MDTDLILVLGLLLATLSIPSMMSAISESRAPRGAVLALALGGLMIALAVLAHPGGYRVADIPDVFFGVMARIIP